MTLNDPEYSYFTLNFGWLMLQPCHVVTVWWRLNRRLQRQYCWSADRIMCIGLHTKSMLSAWCVPAKCCPRRTFYFSFLYRRRLAQLLLRCCGFSDISDRYRLQPTRSSVNIPPINPRPQCFTTKDLRSPGIRLSQLRDLVAFSPSFTFCHISCVTQANSPKP